MNALINSDKIYSAPERNRYRDDKTYLGDIFAAAIVVFFTVSSLTISGWSAILYVRGHGVDGGPLGFLFQLVNALTILA